MGLFQRQRQPEPPRGVCQAVGCERRVPRGAEFCASCALERWQCSLPLSDNDLRDLMVSGVRGVRNIAHAAAEQILRAESEPLYAPLIAYAALDQHCYWCCHALTEEVGFTVLIEEPPAVCAEHTRRHKAHLDMTDTIDSYLAHGHTSEQLAERWRNGYLGDRLHDDDPM